MSLKYHIIIILPLFLYLTIQGCDKPKAQESIVNQTYNTSYGTISRIDVYPLFAFDYTSDYQFDEYLQTGTLPLNNSIKSDSTDFRCTCFSASGEDVRLFGRNYDWDTHSSYFMVFTKPENAYASVSTVDLSFFDYNHNQTPDFQGNQNTIKLLPYYPFDGMNEKGVAIGMNALSHARSPNDASKVTIGELQLIRLVLDYAASTNEAINLIQQYNISMEDPPIHYLIADSTGHSVIIEFVEGKMQIINNSNPWQVTTNFIITGLNIPQDVSCWRYNTADETLKNNNGNITVDEAENILKNVSVASTRWSVVYNIKSKQIQIAMGRNFENTHYFTITE